MAAPTVINSTKDRRTYPLVILNAVTEGVAPERGDVTQ